MFPPAGGADERARRHRRFYALLATFDRVEIEDAIEHMIARIDAADGDGDDDGAIEEDDDSVNDVAWIEWSSRGVRARPSWAMPTKPAAIMVGPEPIGSLGVGEDDELDDHDEDDDPAGTMLDAGEDDEVCFGSSGADLSVLREHRDRIRAERCIATSYGRNTFWQLGL